MATYKKRGYKPKSKEEIDHVAEENSTTAEVFNTLDETASKTEDWVIKNQKYIFVLIGIVAAVVLGYLGYNEFIAKPAQTEAMNDMYQPQKYYNEAITATDKDSLFNLALNGGEGKYGMLDIITEHSGTPAANLATYYAGMAYLNMKDYNAAIEYLKDFSSDDILLSALAKGAIGDAYAQLDQSDQALSYYTQAIKASENAYTSPKYLFNTY